MPDNQTGRQIEQLLGDGEGRMESATQLYQPPCHLCGTVLALYFINLECTGVGRYAVCIPCANSRYAGDEPKWLDPNAPGVRAVNIEIAPVRFVPSRDGVPGPFVGE